MSMNTLLYGLIFFTCEQGLVEASRMSSPIRGEDGAPLLLYNPSGHQIEPFEYAVKRESDNRPRESSDSVERGRRKDHPGTSYIRIGRSQEEVNEYNNEAGEKLTHGRLDNVVRFGRSSLKVNPHHRIDQLGRGFVRIGKSGSSGYARFGRSAAASSAVPSEAEMDILCPNILVDEDARGSEDLQLYLARLMYICNNNNNNNNNGVNGERSEENLHRNNLEFVEVNGDTV